jgi:hypothetical protein
MNSDTALAEPSEEALKAIFDQSTAELVQVQSLIGQGKYAEALLGAKAIVDRVSLVNPKGKFAIHIPVSGILSNSDLKVPYSDLKNPQKEALARAVTSYKGGYFLDTLNLYKRAKIAYVVAFYGKMQSQLLNVDREMMVLSLMDVYSISILIADRKTSDTYLLFDSDIANPDQQYFFNRELIQVALSLKDLNFDERSFRVAAESYKAQQLKGHWDSIKIEENTDSVSTLLPIRVCVDRLTASENAKYKRVYHRDYNYFSYEDALAFCEKNRDSNYIDRFTGCLSRNGKDLELYDAKNLCLRDTNT